MRALRAFAASLVLVGAGVVAGGTGAAPPVHAAQTWAPASSAAIHPGVMTFTDGAQCTANFVYGDGTNVYLGQAAHCAGTGGSTDTDGCSSATLPEGTPVDVDGATKPGTMVYSSWVRMQAAGEKDANTCAFNDLALIKLDPADAANVNPSIPFWGGPVGLASGSTALERVYSYGNSELRLGLSPLSPKVGTSLGDVSDSGGWSQTVYTLTPGIPGDSGSAFLDANGNALGILSTLEILPFAGGNGVGTLAKELDYMHAHFSSAVNLVNGTQPFTPPPV
jgi:hypothetical protein